MAWVKVPLENHPVFHAALPRDSRVETVKMFGGVAAKVNGNVFAALFGQSTAIWLPEPERAAALALKGAAPFDPMGNGRVRSDKVMLPAKIMREPAELRRWIARAFKATAALPKKAAAAKPERNVTTSASKEEPVAKRIPGTRPPKKRATRR